MSPRQFSFAPLVFLVLWLLWFLLPPTRNAAQNQWTTRLTTVPTPMPYSVSVGANDISRDAAFVRALDSAGPAYEDKTGKRWKSLEAVGKLFPDDADICATQIVTASRELHLGATRQLGPSSNADPNWSVKLTKVQQPDPRLLKSWFAATERGAKLEPNNAFWDWARVIGLLASSQDDEVWPLLRAARNKTNYDDHPNAASLARLSLARRQLSPIEQIGISSAALFPHYASMREAARQISDNASGLRLSGDKSKQIKALQGLDDFAQMGRLMRRDSKSSIGSLVGTAIENIALYGGSYSPFRPKRLPKPRIGSSLSVYASNPHSLVVFARNMGRNDIATQLGKQWVEIGAWRAKTRPAIVSSTLIGVNVSDIFIAQSGDWFGSLLIAAIPTFLIVALCCSLLLRFVPSWQRESKTQLSLASWLWGTLLSILALLLISSPAIYALLTARSLTGAAPIDFLLALFPSSTTGAGFTPLIWQYHFPVLVGFLAALWLASLWDARRQGKQTLGSRLRALFHAPDDGMARFDATPLLVLASLIGAFFLLTAGVVAYLVVPSVNENYESIRDYAGFVLLGLTIILALPALLRLKTPQGRAFALILARRFAWGQLIFLTLLWGLLWMAATPAQHRFDTDFVRQQQIGEFQLIRKQLGL